MMTAPPSNPDQEDRPMNFVAPVKTFGKTFLKTLVTKLSAPEAPNKKSTSVFLVINGHTVCVSDALAPDQEKKSTDTKQRAA
jgi:hypothetical protein